MERKLKLIFGAMTAMLGLASCAQGDYATLSVTYPAQAPGANDPWPRTDISVRERIAKSFWQAAEANGYECRAHVKRVEEITCRGPKDMHVTFKPTLNKPEFVATFNWVELGDRTGGEFRSRVETFSASLLTAVDDESVRLAVTAE